MALSSRYRGKILIVTAHMTHIDAAGFVCEVRVHFWFLEIL